MSQNNKLIITDAGGEKTGGDSQRGKYWCLIRTSISRL